MIFLRKQIISSAINFPFYYLLRIKENPKIHFKKKKQFKGNLFSNVIQLRKIKLEMATLTWPSNQ